MTPLRNTVCAGLTSDKPTQIQRSHGGDKTAYSTDSQYFRGIFNNSSTQGKQIRQESDWDVFCYLQMANQKEMLPERSVRKGTIGHFFIVKGVSGAHEAGWQRKRLCFSGAGSKLLFTLLVPGLVGKPASPMSGRPWPVPPASGKQSILRALQKNRTIGNIAFGLLGFHEAAALCPIIKNSETSSADTPAMKLVPLLKAARCLRSRF